MPEISEIKLTQFSHGSGCGCKISPNVLDRILSAKSGYAFGGKSDTSSFDFPELLVGYQTRDDAAVFDLGNGWGIISTTDFFMPIVDDPFDFGRIAAVNAISDIYAMGGTPLMAISILGWPINKIDPAVAQKVIEGGRYACMEAGIPLAGGHSIDSPEPIFGLAVTGKILNTNIKRNNTAKENCLLYLTKPLGIGILTTAQKKCLLKPEHSDLAKNIMVQLNKIGEKFGNIKGITAMTDVTGFGLLGHLCEMAEGSGLSAEILFDAVPKINGIDLYIEKNCFPGGTNRNWESYGHKISGMDEYRKKILADPQTSGGLLIAVEKSAEQSVLEIAMTMKVEIVKIGRMIKKENQSTIRVE